MPSSPPAVDLTFPETWVSHTHPTTGVVTCGVLAVMDGLHGVYCRHGSRFLTDGVVRMRHGVREEAAQHLFTAMYREAWLHPAVYEPFFQSAMILLAQRGGDVSDLVALLRPTAETLRRHTVKEVVKVVSLPVSSFV